MKYIFPLSIVSLVFLGAACEKTPTSSTSSNSVINASANQNQSAGSATVTWMKTGNGWQASGTPPTCPSPVLEKTPVSLAKATAVLYPGQTRGGQYKPHGGFRFDRSTNTDITVVAPMDADVVNAARYIESGETQYLFTFLNSCGIMYRFDHLLTLSPAMQKIADALPPAQEGDSRTTNLQTPVPVQAGDTIATAVGFLRTKNVSVDFGVYDLRSKNAASATADYSRAHSSDLEQHAICWLPILPGTDATNVAALPAGDQASGKKSDYCQ